MKTKYAALILVAVFGLAVASFADKQPTLKVHTQTLKIKAHGETVAELKVSTTNSIRIVGGGLMLNPNTPNAMTFVSPVKGGITVRINGPGELPITLKADEVEIVYERQIGPLYAE